MSRRAALAVIAVLLVAGCTSGTAGSGALTSAIGTTSPIVTTSSVDQPSTSSALPSTSGPATAHRAGPLTPWPTYHGDAQRTGVAKDLPAVHSLAASLIDLDGAVYASPIVAGQTLIVATENDTVYGLDATGRQLWKTGIGSPTPRDALPCGNIDPLGITGTPVYDPAGDTVFVVASLGPAADHELIALNPQTGAVRSRTSVDLPGVDQLAMQQRGALTVNDGKVWVPFGGLAGDCGQYLGRVVGVPLTGGPPVAFTVPTTREGGIWTPPGPTVLGGDLLVAVGNGESTGSDYDFSDSVLRLHGTTIADSFSPDTWADDNAADLDLGSQGPALVSNKWVFADGKSGTAYVLRADHLGGIGGQVSQAKVCPSFGGTAVDSDVVYVPCADGLAAVRIGADGAMTVLWRAGSSITGSPVVGGGRVFSLDSDAGVLHALDPATGKANTQVAVGRTNRFATPAISGGRLYVPTLTGLAVVTPG